MAKRRKHGRKKGMSELSRRRKHSRRRGMREGLSGAFSTSSMQASGKAMLSGAVGGAIAMLIQNKLLSEQKPLSKILTLAGTSFLFGAVLKMPNVGAGIASGIGQQLFSGSGGMKESSYLQEEAVEFAKLPPVLEEGEAEFLQESYLQESYLQEMPGNKFY